MRRLCRGGGGGGMGTRIEVCGSGPVVVEERVFFALGLESGETGGKKGEVRGEAEEGEGEGGRGEGGEEEDLLGEISLVLCLLEVGSVVPGTRTSM